MIKLNNLSDCENKQSRPLISVIMNCYNGEKFLAQALESVIAQTYTNWEIIFWDNQSRDNSAEIFKSYRDSRFKYFYATKNTRLYEARNYAFEKTTGEFIAFLDVDDFWLPKKLESQISIFHNPDVGLVCSNYYIEKQNSSRRTLAFKKKKPPRGGVDELLDHYYVGLLTLVLRRTALSFRPKPFDSRCHVIGDFELTINLSYLFKIGVIQEPLAVYRIHGSNESLKQRMLHIIELENWVEENHNQLVMNSNRGLYLIKRNILYMKAMERLFSGDKTNALKLMFKMPWCKYKIKIFISLLLPIKLLKYLKNESLGSSG